MEIQIAGKTLIPPRVFCIGCNYAAHIQELHGTIPKECVVFMKPPLCLVPPGREIRAPRGQGAFHYEVELVVAIGKRGREISREAATDYIAAATVGLDLTLRDLQKKLTQAGHPWERCKAFEQSAPIGEWTAAPFSFDLHAVPLACYVNGILRQSGNTRDMLIPVEGLIAMLSETWELLPGDLIFTGTPPGVGALEIGDTVTITGGPLGEFSWRIV